MDHSTQTAPPEGAPRIAVRCFACTRPAKVPVPLMSIPKISGPYREIVICEPCGRAVLTEHQMACPDCRTGVDCEAASGAKAIIRRAVEAAR